MIFIKTNSYEKESTRFRYATENPGSWKGAQEQPPKMTLELRPECP